MTRTGTLRPVQRIAAATASMALLLGAGVALANSASAATPADDVLVYSAPTPVDPQPVVPGHEGDTLMRVNVAMAATADVPATRARGARAHHARGHRA
jgi:hypothetical protein